MGFRADSVRVIIDGYEEFEGPVHTDFMVPPDHPIVQELRVVHNELLLAAANTKPPSDDLVVI